LSMALDESKETDIVMEEEGVTFVVDKQLAAILPMVFIGYANHLGDEDFFVEAIKC
jgi:Fe-S cluster assembly iron-binding protein IscA